MPGTRPTLFVCFLLIITILVSGCSLKGGITDKKKTSAPPRAVTARVSVPGKTLYEEVLSAIESKKLANSLNSWMYTPYKFGGESREGVDCSAFVKAVYSEAFNINLSRSAVEMLNLLEFVPKEELKEADLVFFNIPGPTGYHVGIYLNNSYFVHVSSQKGVMISGLNEAYFSKYYLNAGRVKKQ
ncbi:MAG: NlpC/P60 family protein [Bacteroidales bacterium]|nr:NlpC/P60 family protein [Bacteroidales bacterium]